MSLNSKTLFCTLSIAIFLSFSAFANTVSAKQELVVKRIVELEISSSINPATFDYLTQSFKDAQKLNAQAILIKMNTPGGLVSTTKEILTLFGESDIPIIVWITPEGASATSAGAIIAAGSHHFYMSEGTNVGAATPIQMSGDIPGSKKDKKKDGKDNKDQSKSDVRSKAINDLVALVQSLSEARGRNPVPFGEMIKSAKSYKTNEAMDLKLINAIVNSKSDLEEKLNNSEIKIKGKEHILKLAPVIEYEVRAMSPGQQLLNIFANPNLAYMLFLIAAALIYLELQAPGGFIAGSIGAVCLVLAGIGFQVLPLNFGAFSLIVLAFVLFIIEIYITSYGMLTIAGLAALISGSLFLYRTPDSYLSLSTSAILSGVFAIAGFVLFVALVILRDHKNIGKSPTNEIKGHEGKIMKLIESSDNNYIYQVKVAGEIWKAQSNKKYQDHETVSVLEQDKEKLILKI